MSFRPDGVLLARDAEGLFWMARYLERVENLARLIDVTQSFESPGYETDAWYGLIRINADEENFAERGFQPGRRPRQALLPAGQGQPDLGARQPRKRPHQRPHAPAANEHRDVAATQRLPPLRYADRAGRTGGRRAQPALHVAEGGRAGPYRRHRGHAVPATRAGIFTNSAGWSSAPTRPQGCSTSNTPRCCHATARKNAWRR